MNFYDLIRLFQQSPKTCLEKIHNMSQKEFQSIKEINEITAACQLMISDVDKQNLFRAYDAYQIALTNYTKLQFYVNLGWISFKVGNLGEAQMWLMKVQSQWQHPAIQYLLVETLKYYEDETNKRRTQQHRQKLEKYQTRYPALKHEMQKHNGIIFRFTGEENKFLSIEQEEKLFRSFNQVWNQIVADTYRYEGFDVKLNKVLTAFDERLKAERILGLLVSPSQYFKFQALYLFYKNIYCNVDFGNQSQISKLIVRSAVQLISQKMLELKQRELNIQKDLIVPLTQNFEQKARQLQIQKQNKKKSAVSREKIQKNKQIQRHHQQTQTLKVDRYERPQPLNFNYEFRSRETQFKELLEGANMHEKLLVKVSDKQLVSIICTGEDKNLWYAYIDLSVLRNYQWGLSEQTNGILNDLKNEEKCFIEKFYWCLKLLLEFYNFYGTNDFLYEKNGQKGKLFLTDYITYLVPIFNEVCHIENIGYLCYQIHQGVTKIIIQTTKTQQYGKIIKKLLARTNLIIKQNQKQHIDCVEFLIQELLNESNKNLKQTLLNHQLLTIDNSKNYHDYFHWRMNYYHKLNPQLFGKVQFYQNDEWVIDHLVGILTNLALEKELDEDKQLLLDCVCQNYYNSNQTESKRISLIRNYYQANHEMTASQKAKLTLKSVLKKLFLVF